MGLDVVEVVLQTEETFAITISDAHAAEIQTVGDLYRTVLRQLGLPYLPSVEALTRKGRDRSQRNRLPGETWAVEDIWPTVKAIVVNQLQVREDEVCENAHFQRDLGAD
jgi:acyl carrier protein